MLFRLGFALLLSLGIALLLAWGWSRSDDLSSPLASAPATVTTEPAVVR